MQKFRKLIKIFNKIQIVFIAVFLLSNPVGAQNQAPLKARVAFLKSTFNLDLNEPISAIITLQNPSATTPVFTQKDFSQLEFHLNLYFKGPGPDGGLITPSTGAGSSSPTPSVPPVKVKAERLEEGWLLNIPINEVRDYYPLSEPGKYQVWLEMPVVQYDPNKIEQIDCDNDTIIDYCVPYNDVIWDDPIYSYDVALGIEPVAITLTRMEPEVVSDIRITGTEFYFDEGSKPKVTQRPLSGVEVRLYKISDCEVFGITKVNYKTYASILTNSNIPFLLADEFAPGEYICPTVAQDEYVVIGYGNADTSYRHIGSSATIGMDDPNWGKGDIVTNLILMTDMRGRKSPGKSQKLKGSELLIVQPEYVEWDTNQEIYPFGFVSDGDWEVEVSVEPPKGFEADQKKISEVLSSEAKAVQFTITDKGGAWEPAKVKIKAKHKKNIKEIDSEIGVKLSKKLAKDKGLTVWGEDPDDKKPKKTK
jgi:hypothetical protein